MTFKLTSDQIAMKSALRRYLVEKVAPLVKDHEDRAEVVPRAVVRAMAEYGLIGGMLPEKHGGFNLSPATYGMLITEVARIWPSLRSILSTSNLAGSIIAEGATTTVREEFLKPILTGEKLACFALTEANTGSDARHIQTRAARVEDGWILNGNKMFISVAPECEIGVVFARTTAQEAAGEVSCFLYERDTPGVTVRQIPKMGMHSCPLGEISFEKAWLPADRLIGALGSGFALAKRYLNLGRCVVAFSALGISEVASEEAIGYAKQRIQFERPIGKFQLVQELIAQMLTHVEVSKLLAYRAAEALEKEDSDSGYWCSMAKRYATEAVLRTTEASMQVFGGAGYTTLLSIERYYRDARHLSIAEGTNQLQTLLIAKSVLGLSALV